MFKTNGDKEVGKIYETFNYDKFSILAENRGQKETKGLKAKKLKTLQRMIDGGTWINSVARVVVNLNGEIVDGAHTLEICKLNKLPVRYQITDDDHFNEVTKRDLIGNVYATNQVTTSWSPSELFNAAVQTKAPLALSMKVIIEENDNFFTWTDLLALLEKDSDYFLGRWRKANMSTFERKDLIEAIRAEDFSWELKHFTKLNLKARIAPRKGKILRAAYDVLWNCREMINPLLFRKSLASIPESSLLSQKVTTDDGARRMLIGHYNKSQGQQVETSSVLYVLKHKDSAEPVLEI